MELIENNRYVLYLQALDYSSSLSNTYPVIMKVNSKENITVRLKKDIEVITNRFYKVEGVGILYKDRVHLLAESIILVDELGLSEYEIEKIENKILGHRMINYIEYKDFIENEISLMENQILKDITLDIYNRYKDDFLEYPAASKFHHAYKHGLVYHTYNMLRLGLAYYNIYEHVNKDLIVSGIILHDLMKIKEIKVDAPEYTVKGRLIGHISLVSNEISTTADRLGYNDSEEVVLLNHVVIAHHGEGEFGSPKEPLIIEALIVHLADMADAKIIPTIEALDKVKVGEFTEQIFVNDRNKYYKHKLTK